MADVYEMMMRIGLHNAAITGLIAISERLTRIHHLSEQINTGFSRWHVALGGFASLMAGGMILGGLEKMVMKTKEFSDELVKIKNLGPEMAAAVTKGEITKKAFDIAQRVPMKVTDLMKIPGMSYSMLGSEEALDMTKVWEPLAKYAFTQQFNDHFKKDPTKSLQDVLRAGELSGRITDKDTGQIDADKLEKFLDMVAKIKAATHGMVNEQTLLGLAKQGGFTLRGMSDAGFYSEAILAQAMGGQRVGTGTMSLMQQFAGGTMRKRTAMGMEELGLLKADEWTTDKGGGVVIPDSVSKRLTGLISKDPLELAAKLRDVFKEQGITDPEEQMRKIFRAFGRQTTQRFTAEEVMNFQQMLSERERMMAGLGTGGSMKNIMNESVSANISALSAAWDNLLTAVAGPNSEQVIKVLQTLTGALNSMTSAVRGMDPELLSSFARGIAYLGVALVGAGAIAIMAAIGPAGWLIMGLAALATVLTDSKFQEALKSKFDGLQKSLETVGQFLLSLVIPPIVQEGLMAVASFMKSLALIEWELLKKGISSLMSSLSELVAFLSSITEKIKHFFDLSRFLSPIKKTNFEDDGDFGRARIIPANFNPGEKKQILQPIQMNLNIDGRTLAQAVADVMEDLYTHPTSAASPNHTAAFAPLDNQFAST